MTFKNNNTLNLIPRQFDQFLDSLYGPATEGSRTGTGPRTATLGSTAIKLYVHKFGQCLKAIEEQVSHPIESLILYHVNWRYNRDRVRFEKELYGAMSIANTSERSEHVTGLVTYSTHFVCNQ